MNDKVCRMRRDNWQLELTIHFLPQGENLHVVACNSLTSALNGQTFSSKYPWPETESELLLKVKARPVSENQNESNNQHCDWENNITAKHIYKYNLYFKQVISLKSRCLLQEQHKIDLKLKVWNQPTGWDVWVLQSSPVIKRRRDGWMQSFPSPQDRNTLYSDVRKPIFISSFCASCSTCLRRRRDQIVFGLFWIIWETRSVLLDVSVNKECQTSSRSHLKTAIMLVGSTYKLSGISLISCPRPALCSLVHDYALYFLLRCSLEILLSIMHGINHYTWANKSTSAPKLQLLKVLFQMTQNTLLSLFILCMTWSKRVVSSV